VDPADLDLRDLLTPAVQGGTHAFASHRVVLLHSGALWTLRQQLIERVGVASARTLLTQLGCAWGFETAHAIGRTVPWSDTEVWAHALPKLQALVGLGAPARTTVRGSADRLEWADSFEGRQQLQQEQSREPVCWTLAGFAGGYLSRSLERHVTCREQTCIAMGDAVCRFVVSIRDDTALLSATCTAIVGQFRDTPPTEILEESTRGPQEAMNDQAHRLGFHSAAMRHIFDLVTRIAPLDSTVLISGESGVGKERIAKYIHEHSRRKGHPYVAINCGALSETLLDSELFGHGRGAFTGASHERAGLFEAANGGTLFLDEIGEIPLNMQVKLLRVLQEREVRRLGENRPRPIDVRIVVATNRRLEQEVAAGRFREDLHYRLRVVECRIPPLRDRPEDLRVLIRTLLERAVTRLPCTVTGFTPLALDVLLRYHWPGNVRELEHAIERACALAMGPLIDVNDLPDHIRGAPTLVLTRSVVRPLFDVERDYILGALALNHGNRTRTAQQLAIALATLNRKLTQYARRHDTPPG
jgi:two-component system, NtrC family, response regulator HydG